MMRAVSCRSDGYAVLRGVMIALLLLWLLGVPVLLAVAVWRRRASHLPLGPLEFISGAFASAASIRSDWLLILLRDCAVCRATAESYKPSLPYFES